VLLPSLPEEEGTNAGIAVASAWLGKATTELGSHRSAFENFDILKFQKMKFKILLKEIGLTFVFLPF
jgi:hypothetical protein